LSLKARVPNAFEKIILVVGIFIIFIGYLMIHQEVISTGFNWDAIQTILMWLFLIAVIILLAVNENMKEELILISQYQLQELKLLAREEKKDLTLNEKEIKLLKSIAKKKRL
jgi:hypothetical protein